MNIFYKMFIAEAGSGIRYKDLPPGFAEKYANILPKGLLEFWKDEGWCSYADGQIWTINPEDYSWLADDWLKAYPELSSLVFYPFARSAFGEFYCLSPNSGKILTIACPRGVLLANRNLKNNRRGTCEEAAQTFFAVSKKKDFDLFTSSNTPMFPAAFERLGPLGPNEVYGFTPLLTLGGDWEVSNLEKVRMDVHIDQIRVSMDPALRLF
ncbi:GAD-like domain-containing protein [Massilia aquatica]|uniref:DUF1851 domain-containing protein n=1 Tax=Massilia aquatica TaxID=2609000 RepID=A0ABX0MH15_9BURK|nr:GAD-like domain-containing protein [Massilia aquatica]NHZ44152.1 DUF1851 domain-containing protein [Massilia aquatica]